MEFDNHFEVPAPPEQVWAHLLDVEAVVPCMPGAELTETVDDTTWKGQVTIKLGAVSLTFKGTVTMTERDEDARRVVLDAKGMEARGKGQAKATVTSTMTPTDDGGTRVDMHSDLSLSGQAAQMGRGMIADVSQRLAGEFADCVAEQLTAPAAEAPAGEAVGEGVGVGAEPGAGAGAEPRGVAPRSKPVGGIRLAAWAVWRAIVRALGRVADGVRRLVGRGRS